MTPIVVLSYLFELFHGKTEVMRYNRHSVSLDQNNIGSSLYPIVANIEIVQLSLDALRFILFPSSPPCHVYPFVSTFLARRGF